MMLSEHLPLLATGPDGIQKLRGLILELAVRGKLVLQDPNDEPASELLKRIAWERARLEVEGVCKKSKPLTLVDEDEQPFRVPNCWQWVRLASVASFENGDRSKNYPSRDEFVPSGIAFINAGHLCERRVDFSDMNFISHECFDALRAGKTRRGDILFCLRGSLGKFGVVCSDEPAAIASSLVIIRTVQGDLLKYLELYLSSPMISGQIARFDNGTAQPNLGAADLSKFVFPLPPLAEQHRIVAKVDELMALCDRLEAEQTDAEAAHGKLVDALLSTLIQSSDASELAANWQCLNTHFDALFKTESSLDAFKQTILQLAVMGKLVPQDPNDESASDLFERIVQERAQLEAAGACRKSKPMVPVKEDEQTFELPRNWEWVRFGSIADTRLGKMLDAAKNRGQLKPYLRNTNVQWWRFDLDDIKEMRLMDDELHEFRLTKGDLLICEGGEPGRCAIWRSELDEMYFQKALHRARPFGGCVSEYLQIVLRQDAVSGVLSAYFTGATIKHFPGDKLSSYVLPLPPVAEQHRIVAKVDELMGLCDRLMADIAESRSHQKRLASTLIETALQAA
jgi:type I restriction enzyme S subunit